MSASSMGVLIPHWNVCIGKSATCSRDALMITPTQYQEAHRAVFQSDAFTPEATTFLERLETTDRFASYGRVTRVVGLVLEATGLDVGLGALCRVTSHSRDHSVLAEVVGFHERGVLLMPLGEMDGLHPGSIVQPLGRTFGVDVGPGLLGRVLNGLGHPIDGKGKLDVIDRVPL
ncbi:MAG: hypothetical protein ABJB66_20975, partial [Gemmatimonadaceae bacterium]